MQRILQPLLPTTQQGENKTHGTYTTLWSRGVHISAALAAVEALNHETKPVLAVHCKMALRRGRCCNVVVALLLLGAAVSHILYICVYTPLCLSDYLRIHDAYFCDCDFVFLLQVDIFCGSVDALVVVFVLVVVLKCQQHIERERERQRRAGDEKRQRERDRRERKK